MLRRLVFVLLPIGIALAALAAAVLVLPACAVLPFAWAGVCPSPPAPSSRLDDLAARRHALEAEIAALQTRVAALPLCEVPRAEPQPEPQPEVVTPAPDIPRDRWEERDLGVLEGCWNLDSDYAVQDIHTRVITPVEAWQMCFDGNGRGRQTLRFRGGATCSGSLSSAFNAAGDLEIDDIANVQCSNGSAIFRRISTCSLNRAGRADCQSRTVERPGRATFTMRR